MLILKSFKSEMGMPLIEALALYLQSIVPPNYLLLPSRELSKWYSKNLKFWIFWIHTF